MLIDVLNGTFTVFIFGATQENMLIDVFRCIFMLKSVFSRSDTRKHAY